MESADFDHADMENSSLDMKIQKKEMREEVKKELKGKEKHRKRD